MSNSTNTNPNPGLFEDIGGREREMENIEGGKGRKGKRDRGREKDEGMGGGDTRVGWRRVAFMRG